MDGLSLLLLYLVPAAILGLLAKRWRTLRRWIGWQSPGTRVRPDSVEGAQAAVLSALGTGRDAATSGRWRVYRASLGVRLLPPAIGLAILYAHLDPDDYGVTLVDSPDSMMLLVGAIVLYSCLYVLRFRAATDGQVLRIRAIWPERRYPLGLLCGVEEDGVHSFRLSFRDGRSVEILKAVEGAAELRHMLKQRLEQNLRG